MSSDNESLRGNEVEVRSQIVNSDSENENTREIVTIVNNDSEDENTREGATHDTEVNEIEDRDRREGTEPDQNKQDAEGEGEKKIVKPKGRKKQLYPNPKFNENTVRTPKGLPAILGHFQDIKFKGRGYEEQDLNRLLKTYEYWSHRFYPKYTFDDSIQRLEVLGNKRGIQVYLKKVRMGIEDVFQEEITQQKLQDEEEIPIGGFVEPFDDQFDQLLASTAPAPEPELTEEQLERIKQNKLRAEEIRREKMSKTGGETSQTSQSEDNIDNVAEVQVNNDEIDLDNILDMINEDDQSHVNSNNLQSKNISQEQVSNAIRKNPIITSDSDAIESDDDISTFGHKKEKKEHESEPGTSSQINTLKRNNIFLESNEESEENSNSNSNDSSNDNSADSMVLNNSLLRKKHKSNSNKILVKSSQNALNRIKKLTVSDSDDDKDLEDVRGQSSLNKSVQKNITLDNAKSFNFSENSNRQRKKIKVSDSDEDADNKSKLSVLKKKRKVLDSDPESLSFSQNSTKQKQKLNISDSDEDADNETHRFSQKKSKLVKKGNILNSDMQVSQSLTKLKKRHNISDSDEDSDSNNVKTHKKKKNGVLRKGKKPASVTQNLTKQKKKIILSDSDEESLAYQNSSIKSMPLKSSQIITGKKVEGDNDHSNDTKVSFQRSISNENNSIDSASESITSSKSLFRHKNKIAVIESDEDSNHIKDALSQITSDHDLKQNSQNSSHRRKRMVIHSDEDSNDTKKSLSEDSMAIKKNNSILERNGSISSSVNMNDSTKNKKRHIIRSDTSSDEENFHRSGSIQQKKKFISSDEETNMTLM